ncbi:hypothetical protein CLOSCI_02727 [[Clostridium] scindens ATCC 35704]|nr:hypothetical protein CLOSCI_02727 [[Clostridium] scindens ATCC 35704]
MEAEGNELKLSVARAAIEVSKTLFYFIGKFSFRRTWGLK